MTSLSPDTAVKPRLLLHICCAPDEAWVVNILVDQYELFCFFCNPNIQPEEEYRRRAAEAARFAAELNVSFAEDPYEPESWERAVAGLEDTPEGGARCEQCFILRFRRTARFCHEMGWPKFTSVMSVSPHKHIEMLDRAAAKAAVEYGVVYESHNFKKGDGFAQSVRLSKELGLYRQDYCGCILSMRERDERNRKRQVTTRPKPQTVKLPTAFPTAPSRRS